ncbi:coiled-coil domain-containing protein 69-like isoform X1 [Scleropages formosus]|uniref:Coiled-coil domain-containing protein 69-like n=2 Tax=Scleropages formosus TaxID=113540 RepID=A0A8C9TRP3_SCLFO|nr:coiled-coil domain-containing protein 69-like isoform X1 [Scleropages formosus]
MGSILTVGKKKKDRSKRREQVASSGKSSMQDGSIRILLENLQQQQQEHVKILWETLKVVNSIHLELQGSQNEPLKVLQDLVEKERTHTGGVYDEQARAPIQENWAKMEELQRKNKPENLSLMEPAQAADAVLQLSGQRRLFRDLHRTVEESMMKRILNANIQAHGSPGEFWEQELESMLFVIEMKNKHLQEQERKLVQMENLMERNKLLEDQLAHAVFQNEQLEARLEKSQRCDLKRVKKVDLEKMPEEEIPVSCKTQQFQFKVLRRKVGPPSPAD